MKLVNLFLIVFLFFGCTNKKNSALIVGASPDYPPFAFVENGQLVGLDIDITKEVAKRLNRNIEFRTMEFDLLLPELQMGNLQMVVGGMTATPERAERVLFSEPYLTGGKLVALFKKDDNIKNFEDIKKSKVVVNEGYVSDDYVTKSGINPLRVASVSDALFLLSVGQANIFISSKIALLYFLKGLEGFEIMPIEGISEDCSIAFSKKHADLANQVQKQLDIMKNDGTLETILKKWGLE